MKFKIAIAAALVFQTASAMAQEDKGRLKAAMHVFLVELEKLTPYLSSEAEFKSEKGKAQVAKSLAVLEKKVRQIPDPPKESPGFRISFGLLSDHIAKTKAVFESGEWDYARLRLNGTTALCASCHLQTPQVSKFSPFSGLNSRMQNVSFNNASFLFVIRRYPEALAQFDELARRYPKSAVTSDQLPELYRRKLSIFTRVLKDPALALANFEQDLANKNLPVDVRENIKGWSEGLRAWSSETTDPAQLGTPELLAYVEKQLPPSGGRNIAPSYPKLLLVLRLSGLLYERLYAEPNGPNTQALLYYLALFERTLAPVYFYSVGDIYLKECVVKFPKQPYSKRCFEAYRDGMTERFFGRPIPESMRKSIEALKEQI